MSVQDQARQPRAPRKVALIILGMMLITAAVSYGFMWQKEVRQQEQYRTMILNISAAMGENPGCFD